MKYWNWRPGNGEYNFGDELSSIILPKVLPGIEFEYSQPNDAEIVAVGSVLNTLRRFDQLKPGTYIWGSGGGYHQLDTMGLKVLAVRGKQTRDLCKLPENTPLGDPALLLPLYYPPSHKKYKIGVVRHMNDKKDYTYLDPEVIIDARGDPLEVIKKITSCEHIVSSSLHGWIVAYAYGISSVPLPLDDGNKFYDFISSLDAPLEEIQNRLLISVSEIASR